MYLSIDTFSEIFGISIFTENEILTDQIFFKHKQFSDFIPYKIKQIKDELGLDLNEIRGIIVNKGPGSYTGVRIGVSIGKTLSYSLKIPIYAYISLDAIAYKYRYCSKNISVIVNAGKGEVYYRRYKGSSISIVPVIPIKLIKLEKIPLKDIKNDFIICKNVQLDTEECLNLKESVAYDGGVMAIKQKLLEDVFKLEPVYIRKL